MYEVVTHFESENDLKNFLKTTRKFSKRFYHKKRMAIFKPAVLRVTAIAISRDLVQIFKMSMDCDMEHDWIPIDPGMRKIYYPLSGDGNYRDIFEHNGFHRVNSILSDGVDIVR